MDTLQIALLASGVAIIAVIYFISFHRAAKRRPDASPRPTTDGGRPGIANRDGPITADDLAAIGRVVVDDQRASSPPRPTVVAKPTADTAPARRSRPETPGLILQLLVVCRDGRRFRGPDVVNAVTRSGLVLGDMDIFHCMAASEQGDEAMFSVANLVEPGSFNMNFIDHFETPGLVLFMTLPGPVDGRSAFNRMLATARQLATALHGDVRDQSRSVLTQQGIEHLLEQITGFEHKRQVDSRRAAHA